MGLQKNIVTRFFRGLMQLLFQVPLMIILFAIVGTVLLVYFLLSVIFRVVFNKDIGGVMSPFAIYANLKNSAVAASIKNMKQKIEERRNGIR
jgi:hypothetical protein